MNLHERYETVLGEELKSAAEATLHHFSASEIGEKLIIWHAFGPGGRLEDERLRTEVAGIPFENPVLFGAGWDKKGRAVRGLYNLGFAGGTIGTVLPFHQKGNPRPRLWTINNEHSVGFNSLGFNSLGMSELEPVLEVAQPFPCPVGLSVGRNKEIENDKASWAHEKVIRKLGKFASYIELGISSPNTADLRGLQDKGPFRELLQSAQEAKNPATPLFVKIDSERSEAELDDMIEVGLEEHLDGFVATNTYMGSDLKVKYGLRWDRPGGLSGADPEYRARATRTVRYIYEKAGDNLAIIGVGGVGTFGQALEKLKAGASAVQVVTAIRPTRGWVAAQINRGLLDSIRVDGVKSIREYIGADTRRGTKAA
jgi:dihydroorotate dehydrogenase